MARSHGALCAIPIPCFSLVAAKDNRTPDDLHRQMVGVELPLQGAAFPRPTSPYMPERFTESLIDPSSYSPYPALPRSRDPSGLTSYLLADSGSWELIDPRSSQTSGRSSAPPLPPAPPDDIESSSSSKAGPSPRTFLGPQPLRGRTEQKQWSSESLPNISPLLDGSPLSSTLPQALLLADGDSARRRARSNSLDSPPSAAHIFLQLSPVDVPPGKTSSTAGKSSIRKAFRLARKTVSRSPNPTPIIPASVECDSKVSPSRCSDEGHSSTSTPCRINSDQSASSDSLPTSSSSDGVRVPAEGSQVQAEGPRVQIAEVLGFSRRRHGWRDWMAGRRNLLAGGRASASNTAAPSPAADTIEPPLPASQLTPPSAPPLKHPSRVGRLTTPAPATYSWVREQLRRLSLLKMANVRRPSPHPLAIQLRRQNSPFPNEVAVTLEAGQKVFPRSVNAPSLDFAPAQGRLRTILAIQSVLKHLDEGQFPTGTITPPRRPSDTARMRAKGIKDFISRRPFEDRMLVYYPDDVFSHISSARPGFGVWDLDFSPYILALSQVDEPIYRSNNASLPRANVTEDRQSVPLLPAPPSGPQPVQSDEAKKSVLGEEGATEQGDLRARVEEVEEPHPHPHLRDLMDSPPLEDIVTVPLEAVGEKAAESVPCPVVLPSTKRVVVRKSPSPPRSSFRHPRPPTTVWVNSDPSESEDEPLAQIVTRSISFSPLVTSLPLHPRVPSLKIPLSHSTVTLVRAAIPSSRPAQSQSKREQGS